jgi:Xaa-Pro aminopeptidase
MDFKGRLQRARAAFPEKRLNALLVTHLPNIRYLCGFSGSAAVLVVGERQNLFFTDGRYTEQSQAEVRGATIKILKGKSALAAATEWLRRQSGLRRVGIDPLHLTITERNVLAASLPRGSKLVEAPPVVERLRMTKDSDEIAKIRAACHLGVELFGRVLKMVRPEGTESELAGELEFAARKAGVDQMAFPTIVAGGPRSALPHGRASGARIPAAGFVVCDFGVILAGYCSDMTRAVHVGRPHAEARRVYEAVREAQQAALEAVKPGITVGEVDQAARKLLQNRKLDRFFTHSTGHGLGLEIHEAPRVASGQDERLRPGMVITIEPGVYLPGRYGVRIEDTVVVTETGCEVLTPCSKDLITV